MRVSRALVAAGALGLLVACRPEDQRTDSVDIEAVRAALGADLAAQLDSGNAAYDAKDYDAAVTHYRRAVELSPEEAAGWFGIYMAEHARGNPAAADSALERARDAAPGASLLRENQGGADR